jgi:hypothetical protein
VTDESNVGTVIEFISPKFPHLQSPPAALREGASRLHPDTVIKDLALGPERRLIICGTRSATKQPRDSGPWLPRRSLSRAFSEVPRRSRFAGLPRRTNTDHGAIEKPANLPEPAGELGELFNSFDVAVRPDEEDWAAALEAAFYDVDRAAGSSSRRRRSGRAIIARRSAG